MVVRGSWIRGLPEEEEEPYLDLETKAAIAVELESINVVFFLCRYGYQVKRPHINIKEPERTSDH